MKFYYTENHFWRTKAEAARIARDAAKDSYDDISVDLVEVDTTRDNVLRMLNDSGGMMRVLATVYVAKGKLKRGGQ